MSQGMSTRVTIAAYPNRSFDGEILKIEPQAIVERNVTMFAVLIRLENLGDLLMPGMNADVEIQIANRDSVPAVPTMALRAESDIPMAALMLGLAEAELREMLAESVAEGSTTRRDFAAQQPSAGRGNQLPVGVDAVSAASSYVDDRSAAARAMASGTNYQFGGDYWVVTMQDGEPIPVSVRTGLTDLEYSEIIDGLSMTLSRRSRSMLNRAKLACATRSSLFCRNSTPRNTIPAITPTFASIPRVWPRSSFFNSYSAYMQQYAY